MKKHVKVIMLVSIIVALFALSIPIFILLLDLLGGLGVVGINTLGNKLFPNLTGY